MSKDVAFDKNGDWDIYNKKQYVESNEKAKQQAKTILAIQEKSWLYNTNLGLLMREYVLGQRHPQYQLFFTQIVEKLMEIEGIKNAEVVGYDVANNILTTNIQLTFDDNSTDNITQEVQVV